MDIPENVIVYLKEKKLLPWRYEFIFW
jgi:hypothetical protein